MTLPPAERFRHNAARFTEVVDAVPDDAWSKPSPCDGWSVRDVVAHVLDTELELLDRMGFTAAGVPDADGHPTGRWRAVRDAMQSVLDDSDRAGHEYDGYFGRTTVESTIDQFYASDLTVHRWDIARGAGLTDLASVEAGEIERITSGLGSIDESIMRSPGLFDAPVEVADGASPTDRLMAWLGRDPSAAGGGVGVAPQEP